MNVSSVLLAFCGLLVAVTAAPASNNELINLFRKALNDVALEKRQVGQCLAACKPSQACIQTEGSDEPRCLPQYLGDACKICGSNENCEKRQDPVVGTWYKCVPAVDRINQRCGKCKDDQVCLVFYNRLGPYCLKKEGDDQCGGRCSAPKCDNYIGSLAMNCHN